MKFSGEMAQIGNNTGISVPAEVIDGQFLIPFSSDKRAETGIGGGDAIEVELTLDTASRAVEPPTDLASALGEVPGAREAYDGLSPSRQKAHVTSIEGAKIDETRQRRIAKAVAELTP